MSNRQNPPHLPMRRPTRLSTYDYSSPGAYYVTICTEGRIPYFNQPELRLCLLELWQALPGRFPRVTLDEFVIMHDHVHGILWLHGEDIKSPSRRYNRSIQILNNKSVACLQQKIEYYCFLSALAKRFPRSHSSQ